MRSGGESVSGKKRECFGKNHPKVSALNFNGNVFGVISVCFCFVFLAILLSIRTSCYVCYYYFIFKYSWDLRVKVNSIFCCYFFFCLVSKKLNILREVVSSRRALNGKNGNISIKGKKKNKNIRKNCKGILGKINARMRVPFTSVCVCVCGCVFLFVCVRLWMCASVCVLEKENP